MPTSMADDQIRPNYYQARVADRYVEGAPEGDAYIVECQGLIEALQMNFNMGSAMKYLFRAGKKRGENKVKELAKAKTYIDFELERLKHVPSVMSSPAVIRGDDFDSESFSQGGP